MNDILFFIEIKKHKISSTVKAIELAEEGIKKYEQKILDAKGYCFSEFNSGYMPLAQSLSLASDYETIYNIDINSLKEKLELYKKDLDNLIFETLNEANGYLIFLEEQVEEKNFCSCEEILGKLRMFIDYLNEINSRTPKLYKKAY